MLRSSLDLGVRAACRAASRPLPNRLLGGCSSAHFVRGAGMATTGLDVDEIIETLKQRKLPSEPQIKELCDKATAILGEEDNVQVVQAPVTICGDLHGEQPFAAAVPRVCAGCLRAETARARALQVSSTTCSSFSGSGAIARAPTISSW